MVNPAVVGFIVLAIAAFVVFAVVRVTGAHRREASAGRDGMGISILPRSSLGWWSVGLAVTFLLVFLAVSGQLGEDLLDSEGSQALALGLKIVLIAMSGISFAAGLVSIIKRKESSVLVVVGMLITLWMGLIAMVAHLFME
jgi:hypothetical protein